jgi:hypothetical protein
MKLAALGAEMIMAFARDHTIEGEKEFAMKIVTN